MSIVIRLPAADAPTTRECEPSAGRERLGGPTDMIRPSAALLPTDGAPARDPAPGPAKVLALDALRLLMAFRGRRTPDIPWADPTFRADVEAVWRQLAPLRSRDALADSFAREASRRGRPLSDDELSPVRIAYAFRWLELRPSDSVAGPDGFVATPRIPGERTAAG